MRVSSDGSMPQNIFSFKIQVSCFKKNTDDLNRTGLIILSLFIFLFRNFHREIRFTILASTELILEFTDEHRL